jgi:hypothetical protein
LRSRSFSDSDQRVLGIFVPLGIEKDKRLGETNKEKSKKIQSEKRLSNQVFITGFAMAMRDTFSTGCVFLGLRLSD